MADQITPEQREQLSAVGAASGLGCAIVATLLLFIGGGVVLDQTLGTAPVFILIGVAVGLLGAGYQLWELSQIGRKNRPAPPITRGLAKLPRPVAGNRSSRSPRQVETDRKHTEE